LSGAKKTKNKNKMKTCIPDYSNGRGDRGSSAGGSHEGTKARSGASEKKATPKAEVLLSAKERSCLAYLAKLAHAHLGEKVRSESADEWRHRIVSEETDGRANGLTEATNADFLNIRSRIFSEMGEGGKALQDAGRADDADRELALYKLMAACQETGVNFPAYPAAIAKTQFRCGLSSCSVKQLWNLFYTVRNRRNTKARREKRQGA
jgi:hypothetical protein